jgi:hypothetical protein
MIQNKTQNRNETSATISKFTYTATSLATRLSQEKTKATDRVLGCSDEEGLCVPSYTHSAPVTQESFLMQPTRMQHCNLQLVTGTVSSGQLCLGKKKQKISPPPPTHNSETSQQHCLAILTPRTELCEDDTLEPYFPTPPRGHIWGKLGETSQKHSHLTTVPLSHLSFSTNWPPAWQRGQP